jgi:hypothetical protein
MHKARFIELPERGNDLFGTAPEVIVDGLKDFLRA